MTQRAKDAVTAYLSGQPLEDAIEAAIAKAINEYEKEHKND